MVAVTGATGLLGGHIMDRLQQDGVSAIALHRPGKEGLLPPEMTKRPVDILDQVSLREAFADVTTVIHSAALVSFNPRHIHFKYLFPATRIERNKSG